MGPAAINNLLNIYQTMSAPRIFDRRAYAQRRARADRKNKPSFLLEEAVEGVCERVSVANRRFTKGLDLGSRAQSLGRLAPLAESWVRATLSQQAPSAIPAVIADEEFLPFAESSFDLVTSVLSLHAVNDLPGALVQIRRVLAPNGLFVAALLGGPTLQELRRAFASGESDTTGGISPRVAPFADVRDLGNLLQRAGFALPVADSERLLVRYGEFFTLAEDLRILGETNALAERARATLGRTTLSAALMHYAAQDSDADGKLRATFETIYLTGWVQTSEVGRQKSERLRKIRRSFEL
jgi:SAM-dependent methyltransferase